MFMLRCACRHVADSAAPGDSGVGEKNLVLDTFLQQTIEVQLDARERAEFARVERQLVEVHSSGARKDHVNIIEVLRRPLPGVAAGAPPPSLSVCSPQPDKFHTSFVGASA
jgi:hypothetical protein